MPFRRRRSESLFAPRRRPRRWSGRAMARPVFVAALALVVAWAVRGRVAFYSALWEGRRAVEKREFTRAQESYERAWQLRPDHPYVHDGAGLLFLAQAAPVGAPRRRPVMPRRWRGA